MHGLYSAVYTWTSLCLCVVLWEIRELFAFSDGKENFCFQFSQCNSVFPRDCPRRFRFFGPVIKVTGAQNFLYSPWKVGIGATWRTSPVSPGATGELHQVAPGLTGGLLVCLGGLVLQAESTCNSSSYMRSPPSRTNPNFPRTVY